MVYPYVKNIVKYKSQIILEICNVNYNYRIIIKPEKSLNDDNNYVILHQKYNQKEGEILFSLFDLYKKNIIDFNTNLRLFKIVKM